MHKKLKIKSIMDKWKNFDYLYPTKNESLKGKVSKLKLKASKVYSNTRQSLYSEHTDTLSKL